MEKKEEKTMLPCQKNCPHFFEGCHKACGEWKIFQRRQADLRRQIHVARKKQKELYAVDNMLIRRESARLWR